MSRKPRSGDRERAQRVQREAIGATAAKKKISSTAVKKAFGDTAAKRKSAPLQLRRQSATTAAANRQILILKHR